MHGLNVALSFRRRGFTLLAARSYGPTGWLTEVRSITVLALVEVGAFFVSSQFDVGNSRLYVASVGKYDNA